MRLFAVGLALWAGSSAWACRCLRPETPEKGVRAAEAVFTGRVLSLRDLSSGARYGREVTFEVLVGWKGVSGSRATVVTGKGGGDCGYPFREGKRYLVFAFGKDGLRTDICTRTVELEAASTDVTYLRKRGVLKDRREPSSDSLYESFHRPELSRILQLVLDEPRLQRYLKRPVVIRKTHHVSSEPGLSGLGQPVRYEAAPPGSHLVFDGMTFAKASVALAFSLPREKIRGEAEVEKGIDGWRLVRFDLTAP